MHTQMQRQKHIKLAGRSAFLYLGAVSVSVIIFGLSACRSPGKVLESAHERAANERQTLESTSNSADRVEDAGQWRIDLGDPAQLKRGENALPPTQSFQMANSTNRGERVIGNRPIIGHSGGEMAILEPALAGQFPIIGYDYPRVKISLYRVDPAEWNRYKGAQATFTKYPDIADIPGEKVWEETLDFHSESPAKTNKSAQKPEKSRKFDEISIDLSPALNKHNYGHVIIRAEALQDADSNTDETGPDARFLTWVQITDLMIRVSALQPESDPPDKPSLKQSAAGTKKANNASQSSLWSVHISDLQTGSPRRDVTVSSFGVQPEHQPDENGLLQLAVDEKELHALPNEHQKTSHFLLVEDEHDSIFMPREFPRSKSSKIAPQTGADARIFWHLMDDGGVYRPGESVRIKGWVRERDTRSKSGLRLIEDVPVRFQANDAQGVLIAQGNRTLDAAGSFDIQLDLREDTSPGRATVVLNIGRGDQKASAQHAFDIVRSQEQAGFTLLPHSPGDAGGDYLAGEPIPISLLAGGGSRDGQARDITWTLDARPANFHPPGWPQYQFGRWLPKWWLWKPKTPAAHQEIRRGSISASGAERVDLLFAPPTLMPQEITLSAAATSPQNNEESADTRFLVHPARNYIGLRVTSQHIDTDTPIEVQALATDRHGQISEGRPVEITLEQVESHIFRRRKGEASTDADQTTADTSPEPQRCNFTSTRQPTSCRWMPISPGLWQLSAVVWDEDDQPNMTQTAIWIDHRPIPEERKPEPLALSLTPDKLRYRPGDTAKIHIKAALSDAHALITARRGDKLHQKVLKLGPENSDQQGWIIDWPITWPSEGVHTPNIDLHIELVGQTARKNIPNGPPRPTRARGSVRLHVEPTPRILEVEIATPSASARANKNVTAEITVRDADGAAVPDAHMILMVLDNAGLIASGYAVPSPFDSLYPPDPAPISHYDLLDRLIFATSAELADDDARRPQVYDAPSLYTFESDDYTRASRPDDVQQQLSLPGRDIDLRPYYNAALKTDQSGKTSATFKLPAHPTTYRLIAVATSGAARFGVGEAELISLK